MGSRSMCHTNKICERMTRVGSLGLCGIGWFHCMWLFTTGENNQNQSRARPVMNLT